MEPAAEAKNIRLQAETPTSPLIAVVDSHNVQQALVNLIDNATKYSPGNTPVRVTAGQDSSPGSVYISVEDEGVGIPLAEQERIFERFYRIGSELTRESTGAGVGLSLVKNTMDAHGGRVKVESTGGGGSRFSLVFPAQQESPHN
jgi:two-component system phosphate regulon sensor histidine kinase PhoR